jgi:hypothetical protein
MRRGGCRTRSRSKRVQECSKNVRPWAARLGKHEADNQDDIRGERSGEGVTQGRGRPPCERRGGGSAKDGAHDGGEVAVVDGAEGEGECGASLGAVMQREGEVCEGANDGDEVGAVSLQQVGESIQGGCDVCRRGRDEVRHVGDDDVRVHDGEVQDGGRDRGVRREHVARDASQHCVCLLFGETLGIFEQRHALLRSV